MTEIRTLGLDEQITEPGFYNISLERHHSQPCDGPSVTSGVLRKMELATPADVWAFSQLNPDRWPSNDRPALRLGRAMAAYVEGGMAEVAKHFLVLPEDKPRRPTPAQIEAFDEGRLTDANRKSVPFWRDADADPRDKLSDADMLMIENMGRALAADPAASAVMGGVPEVTMAWQDEITGLWLLSRPDTVNFDGTVTDYKKINTQGRPFSYRVVDGRITDHGYDMQLAFAAEVFERLTGEWPSSAGIIAQWDQAPHHVILREIAEEDLRIGQWRNRRAIARFAECLASGHWPGPGDDVGAYQRPEWQRTMLMEEMQVAGTAP
ncbi:MAG: PD-(D/E)XK nuclease-like domain-containing protein [Paracoccaceae bacterium]